jgi:hypothetical protein
MVSGWAFENTDRQNASREHRYDKLDDARSELTTNQARSAVWRWAQSFAESGGYLLR